MSDKINLNKCGKRQCLLDDFLLGLFAAESCRRICAASGQDAVNERTARWWFDRFRSGNYSLEDESRQERPTETDDKELRRGAESNPRQTTRELTNRDLAYRVEVCTSLLSFSQRKDWLSAIITGDEKWVVYVNYRRRFQWVDVDLSPEPEPKLNRHTSKLMLCVWWDFHGILYFELLLENSHITADYYCSPLRKLADQQICRQEIRPQKRKVRFLHDNARPHVAKNKTKTLRIRLGCFTTSSLQPRSYTDLFSSFLGPKQCSLE
ncbi:unnamed protein product [Euphydryas editha]|uniref:Mos1 transposase HTH domain-containing protein n=1 Tax=Euphydryas editha TaxID=104508 RepID=A0AAU9TRF1_EUPED|nr:unnamed protein product [Euphydryas editha]